MLGGDRTDEAGETIGHQQVALRGQVAVIVAGDDRDPLVEPKLVEGRGRILSEMW